MSHASESDLPKRRTRRPEEAPLVRAFPWQSLEATTRSEVRALREVRRWFEARVNADALRRAARDLLGASVDVRVRRAQRLSAAAPLDGGVAVHLLRAGDPAPVAGRSGALFEAERSLAAVVVASAIRRPLPRVTDASNEASAGVAGALAAVVGALARRAHAGEALRVVAAGRVASLEDDLRGAPDGTPASGADALLAVTLTVLVNDDAYAARLVVPREQALLAPDPPWTRELLSRLGPTPLSIPIVACRARCTVAEWAELRPGDVLLPGTWPLARGERGERGEGRNAQLTGPVWLAAPCSEAVGVRAILTGSGHLVLSGEVEPLAAAEERMAEPGENVDDGANENDVGALLGAIGDVPVVVRVEIGEARMAAREWASLGRGDVISLGRRVGEQVVLRVGGVPVARGQLVEVDGHVGVRIDERISEERTTA